MQDYLSKFAENFYESVQESWILLSKQIPGVILAIFIVSIGVLISMKIGQLSRRAIVRRTSDPITINFLTKAVKILFSALFIMYALKVAGLDTIAAGILTAAGASAVIIGFAFRDIGENFISGIILSFNRPFNVDDTVSIGEIFGKIKNIEFRYTKLRTFDGRDVYIPNSDVIKKPVYNFTEDGFYRFDFTVGIAYEDDIPSAEKLIMETIRSMDSVFEDEAHPNFVFADELGVSTVNLKVHFWIKTFEYGTQALMVKGDVVSRVKRALLEAGFGLPANIVELKMYGAESSLPLKIER